MARQPQKFYLHHTGYSWLLKTGNGYYSSPYETIMLTRWKEEDYKFSAIADKEDFKCDSIDIEAEKRNKKFVDSVIKESEFYSSARGKGNRTFKSNVQFLQSFILKQLTTKQLEASLHEWNIEWAGTAYYRYKDCKNIYGVNDDCSTLWVAFTEKKKIISLGIEVSESYLIYRIFPQLKQAGYVFTEADYNRFMFNRNFGVMDMSIRNKQNKLFAGINVSRSGAYRFTIWKP